MLSKINTTFSCCLKVIKQKQLSLTVATLIRILFRLSHLHHIRNGGHGVTEGLEQPLDLGSLGRPLPLPEAGLLHALQRLAVTLGCQVVPLHALVLELQTEVREDFTITEMAPTRAFSWLKPPPSAFTFKTL